MEKVPNLSEVLKSLSFQPEPLCITLQDRLIDEEPDFFDLGDLQVLQITGNQVSNEPGNWFCHPGLVALTGKPLVPYSSQRTETNMILP